MSTVTVYKGGRKTTVEAPEPVKPTAKPTKTPQPADAD